MIKRKEFHICLLTMMLVQACFEMPSKHSAEDDTGEDSSSALTLTILDSKI